MTTIYRPTIDDFPERPQAPRVPYLPPVDVFPPRGPLMPPVFTDPSRLPDVGLESAMGGRLAPVKSGLVKNLKGGLMPGKRPVRTAAPGQPGTPGTPTPTTPPPGGPVGAPGSPEWYASQPSTFWHGTGPLPAGADPATYNPAMAAATANNPALAAYARSGLDSTSTVFNRPGAQPGAPAGTPGATPVPISVNPPPPSSGPMANPAPAPSYGPAVAPPPPVTTVGVARPPAASNRPMVSPITTTVVVPAVPAPAAAPATKSPAVTTTYSSAAAPATKTPAAPTYKPKTATFADGGRIQKRRRRKPMVNMRPMGLDMLKPAEFGPIAPSVPPSQGPGIRPADFGPFVPQPPIDTPGIAARKPTGDFGPLPPGLKPAWRPGMPMPELIGDDKPFDPWARSRAMSRPMTDFGLESLTRMQAPGMMARRAPFTNGYADGGRVRRAPITIENGYADGGEVGSSGLGRGNASTGGLGGRGNSEQSYLARLRARALEQERGVVEAPWQEAGPGTWSAEDQRRFDERWDQMTLTQALQESALLGYADNRFNEIAMDESDPLVQQFLQQYGTREYLDENGRPQEAPDSQNRAARGFVMGYGEPRYGNASGDAILQDGTRILRLPDGRYIREEGNLNGAEVAGQHRADETRRRELRQMGTLMLAAVITGGLAYGALAGAGAAAATGGDVLAAAAGQGFGTATGVAGATGATGAAAGTAGGIGLAAEGAAGVGTVSGAGTVGGTVGTAAGITGGAGAIDVAALAANPAVQGAASTAGQSVGQWLSNPANLQTAMRIAGTVGSLIAGGNSSGGQVQPIPAGTGTPIPGTGTGVTVPGAVVQPGGGASGYTEEALDPAFLESLDPANFEGGPADLSNWQETRGRFRPLEDMLFDDAMKAGSAAEQEAAAGTAGADVEQTFTDALNQQRDRMITQGVNPDAGVGPGLEIARLATLDKAKAAAGAKNIARRGEKDRGEAARARAATIGGQISGQALNADNIGLQYDMGNRRMALDAAGRRADLGFRAHEGRADRGFRGAESAADREFQSGERGADRTWRSGESAAARELQRQIANANIEAGNYTRGRQDARDTGASIGQAIGTGLDIYRGGRDMGWWGGGASTTGAAGDAVFDWGGAYADGGRVDASKVGLDSAMPKKKKRRDYRDGARVEGAGTGTSDSIRARLSDGEGVLNAEAMELLDSDNPGMLDELNDQGLKIRAVRKALKRGMSDFGLGG